MHLSSFVDTFLIPLGVGGHRGWNRPDGGRHRSWISRSIVDTAVELRRGAVEEQRRWLKQRLPCEMVTTPGVVTIGAAARRTRGRARGGPRLPWANRGTAGGTRIPHNRHTVPSQAENGTRIRLWGVCLRHSNWRPGETRPIARPRWGNPPITVISCHLRRALARKYGYGGFARYEPFGELGKCRGRQPQRRHRLPITPKYRHPRAAGGGKRGLCGAVFGR